MLSTPRAFQSDLISSTHYNDKQKLYKNEFWITLKSIKIYKVYFENTLINGKNISIYFVKHIHGTNMMWCYN